MKDTDWFMLILAEAVAGWCFGNPEFTPLARVYAVAFAVAVAVAYTSIAINEAS